MTIVRALSRPISQSLRMSMIGGRGVSFPLQIAASRGEIMTLQGGATSTSNNKQVGRHRFYVGSRAVSELRFCYPGWWVDATNGKQNMEAASYRVAGTCEIGGVVRRQKFNGVNDGTVNSGDPWVEGVILPSAFGLEQFEPGTEIWVKSEREVTVGQKHMFHQTPSYSVPITGETYYVGGSGATSQLDNAGALVTTGGWSVQAHVWLPLMVLGRPVDGKMMAVMCFGDSQINGDGGGSGDGTGATGGGIYRRALLGVDSKKIARAHVARSSNTAGRLAADLANPNDPRLLMLQYATHVELSAGGNDYSAGTLLATALTSMSNIRAAIKGANPNIYLSQQELIAKTDGTWTTVGGQTPRAGFETGGNWRDPGNANIAAAVGTDNLDEYVSFAPDVYVDPTFTDRFKANYSGDGTHLNATGQPAQVTALAPHFSALRQAYEDS